MKKISIFLMFIMVVIFLLTACPFTTVKYKLTMLEPSGEGTVNPVAGEYSIEENKEVSITATPADEWQFVKWEINEEFFSDEKEATPTMDSNKKVKAFFEKIPPEEYTLNMLKPDGDGSVDPSVGDHDYTEGTEVTLTATPDNCWEFVRWEVDGTEYSTDLTTTLTIDSDKEVKAFFEEIPPEEYTLTMLEPSGEGTVDPYVGDHDYTEGTEVTLTATPDNGWEFVRWEVDGADYSTDTSATITMDSDKEVQAFFEEIPPEEYTLTMLEPKGEGTTYPSTGTHEYLEGTELTLIATPLKGWQFDKWEINEEFYSSEQSTSLIIDSDKKAQAFFSEAPDIYTLKIYPVGNGWIKITPEKEKYYHGEIVTLEAFPSRCSEFDYWTGDVKSGRKKTNVIMDSNKKVYAIFSDYNNPIIKIDPTTPVPKYTNRISQTFLLSFSSDNKSVDLTEVSTEVSSGDLNLDYVLNGSTGQGTLTWQFTSNINYERFNCKEFYATVTVEDSCGNTSRKTIKIIVDNVWPDVTLSVLDNSATDLAWFSSHSGEVTNVEKAYSWKTRSDKCDDETQANIEWNVQEPCLITLKDLDRILEEASSEMFKQMNNNIDSDTKISFLAVAGDTTVTLDATSQLITDFLGSSYPNFEETVIDYLNNLYYFSYFFDEYDEMKDLGNMKFYAVTKANKALWDFDSLDCEEIGVILLSLDKANNFAYEMRKYRIDNEPPQVTFKWQNDIDPEPCATEATMTYTIEDGSFYDNSPCTAGLLEVEIEGIPDSYIRLQIPPIETTNEFNTAGSFEEYVSLSSKYENGVYTGNVYVDVSGSDIGGQDCGTLVATLTGYDCCGDCESKKSESKRLSFNFDSKPPEIVKFTTDLNDSECNTATYTQIYWNITDGSYRIDPQDCDIATLTVSHGYLTNHPEIVTNVSWITTDYASSTNKTEPLYWVFEGIDCEDITATLTAQDICCGCINPCNKTNSSITYNVDNMPPRIDIEVGTFEQKDKEIWATINWTLNENNLFSSSKEVKPGGFTSDYWEINIQDININTSTLNATYICGDGCGNTSTATATIPVYKLTMEASPTEGGTCSSLSNFYPQNTKLITIVATPNTNLDLRPKFTCWESTAGTITDPSSTETTFTMPTVDVTITAIFTLQYQ
ncbi:MAG: hypothetical protein FXF54_04560 [Kosmotoga sp.]|nr:MAG: hypothetical protein FXF54_04560 [Kosmotoga sp.]